MIQKIFTLTAVVKELIQLRFILFVFRSLVTTEHMEWIPIGNQANKVFIFRSIDI